MNHVNLKNIGTDKDAIAGSIVSNQLFIDKDWKVVANNVTMC